MSLSDPNPPPAPSVTAAQGNMLLFIIAGLIVIASGFVVLLQIFAPAPEAAIAPLLSIAVPTIAAFAALYVSQQNARKIDALHVTVNSRLSELVALAQTSSHAAGVAQGTAEGLATAATIGTAAGASDQTLAAINQAVAAALASSAALVAAKTTESAAQANTAAAAPSPPFPAPAAVLLPASGAVPVTLEGTLTLAPTEPPPPDAPP